VVVRLVLVDATALMFRMHFGFGIGSRLETSQGEDTSIAYGVVNVLLNLLELQPPPTHFAVVFDAAGKTFR
jgi:5'-3' exonuclease